jgi:hypothetical protein
LTLQNFCIIEYQCGIKVMEIISLPPVIATPNPEELVRNLKENMLKR